MHLVGVLADLLPRFRPCKVSQKCLLTLILSTDSFQDDHEQEKITKEQKVLAKAKKREECTRKHDQAAKAAQRNPLKIKTVQVTTTNVPTVIDKAVTFFSLAHAHYRLMVH